MKPSDMNQEPVARGGDYIDRVIDDLLMPPQAMTARDLQSLHQRAAELLHMRKQSAPAPVAQADQYELTDLSQHIGATGLALADGDKRLVAMVTCALGPHHKAMHDLADLLLAARGKPPAPAPVAQQPLTHMQAVLLWGHRSDGPSTAEIVSFASAVERACAEAWGIKLAQEGGAA